MGGDVFIIDDPHKPKDALSDVRRQAVNQWMSGTLLSRLDNNETDVIIEAMQRLHLDDLTGDLLREAPAGEHFELPAIAIVPQDIPVGGRCLYHRSVGEVLHPVFKPEAVMREWWPSPGRLD